MTMTEIKAKFRDGARFQKGAPRSMEAAAKVYERLREIEEECDHRKQAEDVLADAKDKASPLHPYFEWNKSKAAFQHNLEQARHLERSIVLVTITSDGTQQQQPAFVNVTVENESFYTGFEYAMNDADMRANLIEQARADDGIESEHGRRLFRSVGPQVRARPTLRRIREVEVDEPARRIAALA